MGADGDPYVPFRKVVLESPTATTTTPFKTYGHKGQILMFSGTLLLATIALVFGGFTYSRVEKTTGMLSPGAGVLQVMAPRGGTLTRLYVRDGMAVKAGEPIASISLDTDIEGGSTSDQLTQATNLQEGASHQEAAANADVLARRQDDARIRKEGVEEDLRALDAQRALVQRQLELARATQQRAQDLAEKGVYARSQLDQYESAVIQATLAVSSLDQRQRTDRTQLQQIEIEAQTIEAQRAAAKAQQIAADAQMREKRVSLEGQRAVQIVATRAGRITAVQAQEGQSLGGGSILALLVPTDSQLVAQIWLPSSSVAFIKPGAPVRIMYDSFPYQQFGVATGHVSVVAAAPVPTRDLPLKAASDEALYPVSITLDRQTMRAFGRDWPLLPGMKFNATIVLEKRSLLQWIFAPVTGVRGSQ